MNIINNLFYIGPYGVIVNFDTGDTDIAMHIMSIQQLEESPNEPLLRYHDDPLIIQPSAMIVATKIGDDLITEDSDTFPEWIIWEGMDGNIYMVQPHHCYDIHHAINLSNQR